MKPALLMFCALLGPAEAPTRWRKYAAVAVGVSLLGVVGFLMPSLSGGQTDELGILKLSILDGETGQPTPARVELLDEQGQPYFADDALLVGGDSGDHDVPWTGTVEEAKAFFRKTIANNYTGTEQFYTNGACQVSLPGGTYNIRVFKGIEYHVLAEQIQVAAGRATEATLKVTRWANLPKQGWYGADSHVHIARPFKQLNELIGKQMQAEDIHVTNLLEWGHSKHFHNAHQYAHGPDGHHHEGDHWLASGQENPRTHFLGHTLILGAQSRIDFRDSYVIYSQFWEEAHRQNALSGWAHWADTRGGRDGIAIDLLDGLLNVIEVLQFDRANYEVWYEALTLGVRLTPIAGTDYMPQTSPHLPGRERFYTRVEGPMTYETWLEGVRRGRTFVTNGPLLEFYVNGKGVGDEIELQGPAPVRVEARVAFDSQRDNVQRLELVENGEVVQSFPREADAAAIRCTCDYPVQQTCWLAVRVVGEKLMEGRSPYKPNSPRYQTGSSPSAAHTAPIFVTLANTPPLSAQRRAKLVAQAWFLRLDDLEKRLADEQLAQLAPDGRVRDTVDLEYLRKNRAALLERIASAKQRLRELMR